MNKVKSLGYAALVAGALLFPKYTMANDTMSEPKSSSKLELALQDVEGAPFSIDYYAKAETQGKSNKVMNKAFATGWEDENGNKKAEMSEIEGFRGEKKATYLSNEKPCYIIRMDGPVVPYSVKKDGKKIDKGFVKKKNKAAVKIDLPNEGPGEYKVSFGILTVKYTVVDKK